MRVCLLGAKSPLDETHILISVFSLLCPVSLLELHLKTVGGAHKLKVCFQTGLFEKLVWERFIL